MIHNTIIEGLLDTTQAQVRLALGVILESGIIREQINLEHQRLLGGDLTESPEELAKRILDSRLRCALLESLEILCKTEGRTT